MFDIKITQMNTTNAILFKAFNLQNKLEFERVFALSNTNNIMYYTAYVYVYNARINRILQYLTDNKYLNIISCLNEPSSLFSPHIQHKYISKYIVSLSPKSLLMVL